MVFRTIIAAVVLVLVAAAPALADDPAAADALNARARVAYDAGDFTGALDLFKKAWGKARLPKYVFNAAKACVRLDDPESALHYYRRYLEAAPGAQDQDAVEKEMSALRGTLHDRGLVRLGVFSEPAGAAFTVDGVSHPEIVTTPAERWLSPGEVVVAAVIEGRTGSATTVTLAPGRKALVRLELLEPQSAGIIVDAPSGATITLGDHAVAPGEAIELSPGEYALRVELPGHQPYLDTVVVAAGEDATITAKPLPLPPPTRRKQRVAGWTVLAVGGAALVAGAVMTGVGAGDMKDANASHSTADGSYVKAYGRGRDLYHGGLWALGSGAGAALAGGLLLLLSPEDAEDE